MIRKQYVVHAAGKQHTFKNAKSGIAFAKRMRKRHGGDASSYWMEEHSIRIHKINV